MCKAHIRAHSVEGKFRCNLCGYVFRHKHHLQRHEKNMHGLQQTQTANPPGSQPIDPENIILDGDIQNTVNLVIDTDGEQFDELAQQHLVVATDASGAPITFESIDLSNVNLTMLQQSDGGGSEGPRYLMRQPEGHIIFQQED